MPGPPADSTILTKPVAEIVATKVSEIDQLTFEVISAMAPSE
jgi:hypothetical protein